MVWKTFPGFEKYRRGIGWGGTIPGTTHASKYLTGVSGILHSGFMQYFCIGRLNGGWDCLRIFCVVTQARRICFLGQRKYQDLKIPTFWLLGFRKNPNKYFPEWQRLLWNYLREENSRHYLTPESKTIFEIRGKEFFRCEKTPLNQGSKFWGVTDLSPLKRISSRDSET